MEYGANPNLKNKKGETTFHILAMHGRTEALQLVLKYENADVCKKDNFQQTPLDYAKKYAQTNCVKLILDYCDSKETFNM